MSSDKPFAVKTHDIRLDEDYITWIQELKQRYQAAQIKAAVKVNSEQLLFNWRLGCDLVMRRAEERWGKGVVEQVSLDLQAAFPKAKGFSARNLWFMKQWYSFYTSQPEDKLLLESLDDLNAARAPKLKQVASELDHEKLKQAASEFPLAFAYVPWMHHIIIVQKSKSIEEAIFYVRLTVEKGLSRNALDDYIRADYFHNSGAALTNFDDMLPAPQSHLAQELLKGNYDLGFIELPDNYDEKELEDALEQRMTRFLLELGEGWAFVGRQKEIIIAGKTRKVDLLFYHIYLRCYVVIELKVTSFDPEFAGKLNFYVNAVNDLIRRNSDNPTIGLLICKDLNKTEVQYALQGITTPLGVATYDNIRFKEIQEQLPTPEQIKDVIKQAEQDYLSEKLNALKAQKQ